jgi:hypothetical protein
MAGGETNIEQANGCPPEGLFRGVPRCLSKRKKTDSSAGLTIKMDILDGNRVDGSTSFGTSRLLPSVVKACSV